MDKKLTTFKKRLSDDEVIDGIVIQQIPRYKTSGLSGDEWRTSFMITMYKKGAVVYERTYTTLDFLVSHFPWLMANLPREEGFKANPDLNDLCDQPGCRELAVSTYRLKKEYASDGEGPLPEKSFTSIRRFCHRHLQRGDCGREDADRNYEIIEGPGPEGSNMQATDESPSAFGGIFKVGTHHDE